MLRFLLSIRIALKDSENSNKEKKDNVNSLIRGNWTMKCKNQLHLVEILTLISTLTESVFIINLVNFK